MRTDSIAADVRAEIDKRGDDCYFVHTFALWVAFNFATNPEHAQRMVEVEAKDNIEDGRYKGRGKEGKAQQAACLAILEWLTTAGEWSVKTEDLLNLASFVQSHRRACVWAILVGKASAAKAVRHA